MTSEIAQRTTITRQTQQLVRRIKKDTDPIYSNTISDRTEHVMSLPRIEPLSSKWHNIRGKLLTASNMAACLGHNNFCSPEDLFLKTTYQSLPFTGNEATRWGQRYEEEAGQVYSYITGLKLVEESIGFMIHPYEKPGDEGRKRYGATPDFMTKGGIMVEIKCPFRRKIGHSIPLYYIAQVQFQLEVTGAKMAHFVQYRPPTNVCNGVLDIYPIMRDTTWWSRNLPVFDAFWDRVIKWYMARGREVGEKPTDYATIVKNLQTEAKAAASAPPPCKLNIKEDFAIVRV